MRVATVFIAVVVAVLLPVLGLGAVAVSRLAADRHDAARAALSQAAQALTFTIDAQFAERFRLLQQIASSPVLDAGANADTAQADTLLRPISQAQGFPLVLLALDGHRLVHTEVPPSRPMPAPSRLGDVEAVVASGEPLVLGVHFGVVADRVTAAILFPVLREGHVVAVLATRLESAKFHALLAAQALPQHAFAILLDDRNVVVARSDDPDNSGMGTTLADFAVHAPAAPAGVLQTITDAGLPIVLGYHAVPAAPGWTMVVAEPTAKIDALERVPIEMCGAAAILLLLASATLATFAARRILAPLQLLADHARAVAAAGSQLALREPVPPLRPSRLLELESLRQGLAAAEASLLSNQSELRDLMATIDLAEFMTRGVDGIIRHWSAGCERLYGWTAAEAVGRNADELLHTVSPLPLAELEATLECHGIWQGDLRHTARDGRERVVIARKFLSRNRLGGAAILELLTDVTAQRRAEAALAQSETRRRLALEAGRVGTFEWDVQTGAVVLDDQMRAAHGIPVAEPMSLSKLLGTLHPEDAPRLVSLFSTVMRPPGGQTYRAEYRTIGLVDGIERYISSHAHIEHRDGRTERVIGMAIDITTVRQAAMVLEREAQQFEELAESRGRALAASEMRLAEAARMEALGRLAGGMAHDFNNVLQAVQSGLHLIEKRLQTDPASARYFLARVSEAADRGTAITGRLLTFARRGELRTETIDAAMLFNGLAEMLHYTMDASIAVQVETEPGLPKLSADQSQLEAVVINLASNARDAMPGGGAIVLRAALANPADCPPELPACDYICLSVADNGEGMPPSLLAQVTEPFFTTKPRGKGTGLGLSMARGFAEQSGGALTIESAVGVGTTVRLWLPRADQVRPPPRPNQDSAVVPSFDPASCALLFAEDEAAVRETLAAELSDRGFLVTQADSGSAALALMDDGLAPDAIVTDLSMPGGVDGIALIQEARRRWPGMPALLVTGHVGDATPEQLNEMERSGPFALVRKPALTDALVERLAQVLHVGP